MAVRESKVERALVRAVRRVGGLAIKIQGAGNRGMPDRLVLLPGTVAFVELKAPGRAPRAEQRRACAKLRRLGQRVLVLDSIEKVNCWMALVTQEERGNV